MKKLIASLLVVTFLSGCAARGENNEILYNEDGTEQISIPRTVGAVVFGAAIVAVAILAASNGDNGDAMGAMAVGAAGGASGADFAQDDSKCKHADDIASDGTECGARAAVFKEGGDYVAASIADHSYAAKHGLKIYN